MNECTVMVRFTLYGVEVDDFLNILTEVDPTLLKQPGLIEKKTFVRNDKEEVVNVVRWESEQHHEQCRNSPEMFEAGKKLMALVDEELVAMEMSVYSVQEPLG